MSLKRKFAFHTTSSTFDYYPMGSKQSSTANQHLPAQTKRKRSNTQPSQQPPLDIKPVQEPTRITPTLPPIQHM
ncbi:hypothetical protein BD770DRAFT_4370 [Pilaira anomala]|nr:hypothetical protein BD770DRAFT_4370 [Pilaira anomala]